MISCLADIEQAGMTMIKGMYLAAFGFLMLAAAMPAAAQRTRRPAPRPTPKPTPARPTASPIVLAAKQQVANQLSNVNMFVDKMGPIALDIENIDKEAKTNRRIKKETIDANETNKKKLVLAIRGMRQALTTLETDFRTKPQLARYLPQIQGITSLCTQSEDNAIAGRFVASKGPLRQAAQKLSDTMAVLP